VKHYRRYGNRKIYDVERKRYVCLEEIARAVARGVDLQVLDHGTGADLTGLVLAQIAVEREREGRPLFSHGFYVRALRSGGSATPRNGGG
jgi:polyhydroxyalkanoate synthesis repressor PhaR